MIERVPEVLFSGPVRVTDEVAGLFSLLANGPRLRALSALLARGEIAAGQLATIGCSSQSAMSQHLKILRDAGVVATRRDQQTIYYRIADTRVVRLVREAERIAQGEVD